MPSILFDCTFMAECGHHDRPRSSSGEVAATNERTVTSESSFVSELN